jgi:spore maturation protein SpmB
MVDVMKAYGVDSFQGKLAAIIQGSTETTFYVLAVYFGSVNISKTRYAVACGLIADAVGLVGAISGVGYAFCRGPSCTFGPVTKPWCWTWAPIGQPRGRASW